MAIFIFFRGPSINIYNKLTIVNGWNPIDF